MRKILSIFLCFAMLIGYIPTGLAEEGPVSSNADLSSLTVAGSVYYDLTPAFNAGTTAYAVDVPNDVSSVEITANTADTAATLEINGTAATSGSAQTVDNLSVGDNTIAVAVTARDGATVKTYTMTIKRAGAGELPQNLVKRAGVSELPQTPAAYAASDYAKYAGRMAVGDQHIAVVKPDGTVAVWGDDTYGQLQVSAGLAGAKVKTVAAGTNHTLALTEDGRVFAWGGVYDKNWNMQTVAIPDEVNNLQGKIRLIAAGSTMSAVVANDGRIVIWGNAADKFSEIPEGLVSNNNVVALRISGNYAVALNDQGEITVWGMPSTIPDALTGKTVVDVAVGVYHWLALTNEGKVVAGGNHADNLSNINNQENVRAIAGGWQFAGALLADGSVMGWGRTPAGTSWGQGKQQIASDENIKAFSSAIEVDSAQTICAMRDDGTLVVKTATADAPQSQIPDGLNLLTTTSSSNNADLSSLTVTGYDLVPAFDAATTAYTVNVPNGVSSVEVTAAIADANATLKINGTAATSGAAQTIDNPVVGDNPVAVEVTAEDGTTVKTYTLTIKRAAADPLPQTPAAYAAGDYAKYAGRMAIGDQHIAVVKPDGTVAVWGDDTYGQLQVPAGLAGAKVKTVAAGTNHTLALTEDSRVFAWGSVYDKDRNMQPVAIPDEVNNLQGNIRLIAAGSTMSAVVANDGRIVIWGNAADKFSEIPEGLVSNNNVVALRISANYAVALNDQGKITVWGQPSDVPDALTGKTVVDVAVGIYHWLALTNEGKVVAGGNHADNLSNINNQENVRAIAGGWQFAGALLADGSVMGWGRTPTGNAWGNGKQQIAPDENIKAFSSVIVPEGNSRQTICAMRNDGTLIVKTSIADAPQSQIPDGLNLLTMTSSSNNADLSSLSAIGYELDQTFDAGTTGYTVNVPNNVSIVDVTATTVDSDATLKINGTAATSGVAQTIDNLVVGDNPVPVEVTAADGTTVKTYTLTINRAAAAQSNNADLSGLTLAGHTLDKTFDAGTTEYVVNIPNAVSSVNITATTADTAATLKINGAAAASGTAQAVDNLVVGDNQVPLEVTAADGITVKTYTLTIKRASLENAVWQTPAEYAASSYGQLVGRIAGGKCHAAAILTDGTVQAWGDNSYGQLDLPAELFGVKTLAAGSNHTLTLKTDGSLIAWGQNNSGQCNIPVDLNAAIVKAIAAVDNNSAALTADNKIYVWGQNISDPKVLEIGQAVNSIAMDANHVLALTENGAVIAWDRNNSYQQCTVRDGFSSNVAAITAAHSTALALKNDGSVVSWGFNDYCDKTYPVPAGLSNVRAIAAGDNSIAAALTADGKITVWGYPCYGLFDIPAGLNQVQGVAAGEIALYAVQNDGAIVAWGSNNEGQCNIPAGLNLYSQVSSNNLLGSLKVEKVVNDGGTDNVISCSIHPGFTSMQTEGTVDVADGVKEVRITARPFSSAATLQINGASAVAGAATVINGQNLAIGDNPVQIKVTAQNGSERTYTLHIKLVNAGYTLPQTPQAYQASEYASYKRKIAAGSEHALALKKDGAVTCWGRGSENQCNTPPGLKDVTAVAAGSNHSLALKKDGVIVGWGYNEYGQCNAPVGLSEVVDIAAGRNFSAAVDKNGSVYVWGENTKGECNVPAGLSNVVDVECGNNNVLALKADGTVVAWGSNANGKCDVPAGLDHVVSIAAGFNFSVALKADGTVVAWGAITNNTEQGGASALQYVKAIAAGTDFIVALKWDGSLCAFDNDQKVSVDVAPFSAKKVIAISAYSTGKSLMALNEDGAVTGGGVASWINLLKDDPPAYSGPAPAIPQTPAAYAASAYKQAPAKICSLDSMGIMVLNTDGTVKAQYSGDDSLYERTLVPSDLNHVKALGAGRTYGMALKDDGTVVVWGNSKYAAEQKNIPENLGKVTAIAAGTYDCLALQEDGTVAAWGVNDFGQGNVPENLSGVTAIAIGYQHCLALKNDGTVVAWGNNDYGQCNVPESLSNVSCIYAIGGNSIALKNDGTVVVWGRNDKGQCDVPEGLSGVVNVSDYNKSTFVALKSNGTVVVWGDNSNGRRYVAPDLHDVTCIDGLTAVKADDSIVDSHNNKLASLSHVLAITNNIVIFRDGSLKYLSDLSNTALDGLNVLSGHYFAINKAELINPADGRPITTVGSQGGYRVKASVGNNYAGATPGLTIIQVRGGSGATGTGGGRVLGCVGLSGQIPVTGSTVSSDFTMPAGISGPAYVDVFVWDGWDTMVPRAKANQNLSFNVTQ